MNFIKEFVSLKPTPHGRSAAWLPSRTCGRASTTRRPWTTASPPGRRRTRTRAGTIAEVADHIDHIRKVAGIDNVGIGADFFDAQATSMVAGLTYVTRYPYLFAELLRRGYSEDDLLKVAGRNHLRAMRQMEKAAERR